MSEAKKESLPKLVKRAEGLRQWLRLHAGKNTAYRIKGSDVILPWKYWPEGPVRDVYRALTVAKGMVEAAMQCNVPPAAEDVAILISACRRVEEIKKISESVEGETK